MEQNKLRQLLLIAIGYTSLSLLTCSGEEIYFLILTITFLLRYLGILQHLITINIVLLDILYIKDCPNDSVLFFLVAYEIFVMKSRIIKSFFSRYIWFTRIVSCLLSLKVFNYKIVTQPIIYYCFIKLIEQIDTDGQNSFSDHTAYELMFDSPIAITIFNLNKLNVLYQNKQSIEIFSKLNNFDTVRKSLTKFKSEKNKTDLLNELLKIEEENFNRVLKYSKGPIKDLFVKMEKVIKDNFTYVIMTADNVNEEKNKLKSILFQNVKSQFLLTISHELNNPLNGLIAYTNKIFKVNITAPDWKERITKYFDRIKKAKYDIKLFIYNLTLYSKISLKEKLNYVAVQLNFYLIFQKILNKYQRDFDKKNVSIKTNLSLCKNVVIISDFILFKALIKNVFKYLLTHKIHDANLNINFKRLLNDNKCNFQMSFVYEVKLNPDQSFESKRNGSSDEMKIKETVNTSEMLCEIILSISDLLKIKTEFTENNGLHIETDYSEVENFNDEMGNCVEFSPLTVVKNTKSIDSLNRTINKPSIFSQYDSNCCLFNPKYKDSKNSLQELKKNEAVRMLERRISSTSTEEPTAEIRKFNNLSKFRNNTMFASENVIQEIQVVESSASKISLPIIADFVEERSNDTDKIPPLSNRSQSSSYVPGMKSTLELREKFKQNVEICNCNTVLIVDDEKLSGNAIKFILRKFKINADYCTNGLDAVNKVKYDLSKTCCHLRYKLIFMDVMMPIMDGVEASKIISNLFKGVRTYLSIVIISAHDVEDVVQRFKGVDLIKDFSCKPVKKSKIEELLNKYFFNE